MLLIYGTLRPLHGKGYPGAEKIGRLCSFSKIVAPIFSDPACAGNRVGVFSMKGTVHDFPSKPGH